MPRASDCQSQVAVVEVEVLSIFIVNIERDF